MTKGKVEIDVEFCKGCALCIPACNFGVLSLSEEFNSKGIRYAVASNPENCTGCSMCALTCPEICIEVYREKRK
jgi:2-oxoglutarate ferredoxin oxidoreductase subunit delta